MDLYFRGRASLHQWLKLSTLEYLTQARRFFEQAVVLDPKNFYAIFGVAAVDVQIAEGYYSEDPVARLVVAEEMMVKALPHVLNVALAHQVFGQLLILTNRAAYGIAECEQALALDRNLAGAHAMIGKAKSLMGRGEETEAHINEALRLCPHHQSTHHMLLIVGAAKLQLSADAEAVDWLRRSIEANRTYPPAHFALAAALGQLGALDEAQTAAKAGLALDPDFTIRRFRFGSSSDNPTYLAGRARICEGLRLAGVPEG